jgi:hypothetical protein
VDSVGFVRVATPRGTPMKARAAVTLSNENGLSRSRPCQESRPAASGRRRPPSAPRRPDLPNVVPHQFDAGRS